MYAIRSYYDHELKQFKVKRKVPVIASMMDVAASGGYYLAMASDAILVHPSTVTGSIGVIMLTVNAKGLLEKVGVDVITSYSIHYTKLYECNVLSCSDGSGCHEYGFCRRE